MRYITINLLESFSMEFVVDEVSYRETNHLYKEKQRFDMNSKNRVP